MTNGFEARMEMYDSGAGEDRVVLIYGGSNETGLRATENFIEMNATVVIADDPDTESIVSERFGQDIEFLPVNATDLSSISKLSNNFREEYDCLDVLASTKSAVCNPTAQADSQLDAAFVVNHLSLYKLVYELHGMRGTPYKNRILIPVSPSVFSEYSGKSEYQRPETAKEAFLQSQFANAALVAKLSEAHLSRPANAYDPGILDTIGQASATEGIASQSTPEAGAQRLVFASKNGYAGGVSGLFYQDMPERLTERIDSIEDSWHRPGQQVPELYELPLDELYWRKISKQSAKLCETEPNWLDDY